MKKENDISEASNMSIGASPMTKEDLLQTESVLKNAFFKEKYRTGLKNLVKSNMKLFKKQYPEWQLKDVLVAVIKDFNPELPPAILLEMTQFIIAEWESSSQKEVVAC